MATKTIGEYIKKYRKEAGLSQSELGDMIGTTKQSISRYEKNAVDISSGTLLRLAQALNVSTLELYGFQKSPLNTMIESDGYDIFFSFLVEHGDAFGVKCRIEEVDTGEDWAEDVVHIDIVRDGKKYSFQPDLTDLSTTIGKLMLLVPNYLITELSASGMYEIEDID